MRRGQQRLTLVFGGAFLLACAKATTPVPAPAPRAPEPTTPTPAPTGPFPLLFEHADASCGTCASRVTTGAAPCARELEACTRDPRCVAWLRCTERCTSPGDACMQACATAVDYAPMAAGNAYMFCTCCRSDCLDSCRGTCAKYRSGLTGPVGAGCTLPGFDSTPYACNRCLDQLFLGGNSKPSGAYDTCLGGSMDMLDCLDGCTTPSCMLECRRTAKGQAATCGASYLTEACCGPCAQACAQGCKDRGVHCP